MTLKVQLWFVIGTLVVTSFLGSFVVSNLSARAYLEEQLSLKNTDDSNALAMTLSNTPDPMMRELLISAQYDTGNHAYIELRDGENTIAFGARESADVPGVPAMLPRWFPIQPDPGVAQVSSGWQALGTLTVESHARFAYRELWRSSKRLFAYFASVAIVAGLLGSVLLRLLTRPLGSVVAQASAIGEGRFITIDEPRTQEFRDVSRAMNRLSRRVRDMLADESARLGRWHQESQQDELTGVLERQPFLERLGALLKRDDASAAGSIVILRLMHLVELNRRHGRPVMDALLGELGRTLRALGEVHEGVVIGRLNGSELAIAVPEHADPAALGSDLHSALRSACVDCGVDAPELATAAASYDSNDTLPQLLQRVDAALAISEQNGGGLEMSAGPMPAARSTQAELGHWDDTLSRALTDGGFVLETYPVRGREGELLHLEAPSRLRRPDGTLVPAGVFMPWAARLGRMPDLDLVVVELALARLRSDPEPVGINLSARLLGEPASLRRLVDRVRGARDLAERLWLEVPEHGVYARLDGFRALCRELKPLGCRLGIEHAGPDVSRMGALYDLGLDYIKVDATLIRAIDQKPGNQAFVRGFCTIAHAIGLVSIVEGVRRSEEWRTLLDLGIDGGTGPFFARVG